MRLEFFGDELIDHEFVRTTADEDFILTANLPHEIYRLNKGVF